MDVGEFLVLDSEFVAGLGSLVCVVLAACISPRFDDDITVSSHDVVCAPVLVPVSACIDDITVSPHDDELFCAASIVVLSNDESCGESFVPGHSEDACKDDDGCCVYVDDVPVLQALSEADLSSVGSEAGLINAGFRRESRRLRRCCLCVYVCVYVCICIAKVLFVCLRMCVCMYFRRLRRC
jgi:hypothetical protein